MDIMFWLIPVAIFILVVAVSAFIWAVKSDQYSDLESPAYKILFDDDSAPLDERAAASHSANDSKPNESTQSNTREDPSRQQSGHH
ncbi:MAG: cbb3-type cytochrome oxidase assembly protein CcoS [Gammaproteobacteria bacterium]|nr:cbb3-type cytochrome oxidase assembly protein CcoS [Gammaproteobacteria bacterium]